MSFGVLNEAEFSYGEYTSRFRELYRLASGVPWGDLEMGHGDLIATGWSFVDRYCAVVRELDESLVPKDCICHPCSPAGLKRIYEASAGLHESSMDTILTRLYASIPTGSPVDDDIYRPPIWVGMIGTGPEAARYRRMFRQLLDCQFPERALGHLEGIDGIFFVASAVVRTLEAAILFTLRRNSEIEANPFAWLLKAATCGLVFIAHDGREMVFASLSRPPSEGSGAIISTIPPP